MCSFLVISFLVIISNDTTFQKNGFNRHYASRHLKCIDTFLFTSVLTSIAGTSAGKIYFSTPNPEKLIVADSNLKNAQPIELTMPEAPVIKTLFFVNITDTKIYIMAGNLPALVEIPATFTGYRFHFLNKSLFTTAVMIDSATMVFRTYKKINGKWNQIFAKYNSITNTIAFERNASILAGDAGFSTDGNLVFDKTSYSIYYVNYYSNTILALDTSLQLITQAHTIDTFAHTITVAAQNRRIITNSTPQREVNFESSTSNGKLFIHSAIKADNDTKSQFENNALIDVYKLPECIYLYSFPIPRATMTGLLTFP